MPSRSYAFEKGGSPKIKITWGLFWRDAKVFYDEQHIGGFDDLADIKKGAAFPLPDGSQLDVRLQSKMFQTELLVERGGKPLPGSAADPERRLRNAYLVFFIVAAISGVLGFLATILQVEFLKSMGIGSTTFMASIVFLLLGLWVKEYRSKVALAAGTALLIVDTLIAAYASYQMMQAGQMPPMMGFVLRILFLIHLIRGFSAIDELRAQSLEPSRDNAVPSNGD